MSWTKITNISPKKRYFCIFCGQYRHNVDEFKRCEQCEMLLRSNIGRM